MKKTKPQFRISFHEGDGSAPRELAYGKHFRVDHRAIENYLKRRLLPRAADLLRIAMSVYAIDRLTKRNRRSSREGWPRLMNLAIEVDEPDFWNSDEIRKTLTECLEFVSGDGWEFSFLPTTPVEAGPVVPWFSYTDLPSANPPAVCLYSGGLDSAAGLATQLRDCPRADFIPVVAWHQSKQRGLVREQLKILADHYSVAVNPVIVKTAMVQPRKFGEEEKSQRCRAFLFGAIGGVVAMHAGAASVEVYESGIGAINLPLMSGMVGSKTTKSCHPRFLRLLSQVVTQVAERAISFRLPFMDKTKAEVVRTLAEDGLDELARSTASCVHYPLREALHKQCGVCPACILRRQAMILAGIEEASHSYKYDVFGKSSQFNEIPDKRLRCLTTILMQVDKLSELEIVAEVPRFFRRHLVGTGVVANGQSLAPSVELFTRYRQEWLAIVADSRSLEWSWANLLACDRVAV